MPIPAEQGDDQHGEDASHESGGGRDHDEGRRGNRHFEERGGGDSRGGDGARRAPTRARHPRQPDEGATTEGTTTGARASPRLVAAGVRGHGAREDPPRARETDGTPEGAAVADSSVVMAMCVRGNWYWYTGEGRTLKPAQFVS